MRGNFIVCDGNCQGCALTYYLLMNAAAGSNITLEVDHRYGLLRFTPDFNCLSSTWLHKKMYCVTVTQSPKKIWAQSHIRSFSVIAKPLAYLTSMRITAFLMTVCQGSKTYGKWLLFPLRSYPHWLLCMKKMSNLNTGISLPFKFAWCSGELWRRR